MDSKNTSGGASGADGDKPKFSFQFDFSSGQATPSDNNQGANLFANLPIIQAVDAKPKKDLVPEEYREQATKLQVIQKEQTRLLGQRDKEILALLLKYDQLQEPLIVERKQIVNGETGLPPIKNFWLTAIKNHPELEDSITEADEELFGYITDISTKTLTDKKGFSLEFHFAPNPYLENETLTKTYELGANDDMLEAVKGCEIKWKSGKNLTVKVVTKKKGKGSKAKTVKKEEPTDSFFRFFSPPEPDGQEMEDEEDAMELGELIEADFQLGTMLRQLIGNVVGWYDGSALAEFLANEDEEDDEDDEDDDSEEEEEQEEEEEEEEDESDKKKGGNKKGGHGGGNKQQNPSSQQKGSRVDPAAAGECQQQ